MINLKEEPAIPLKAVPRLKWLPKDTQGRRLAYSTIWRWCTRGSRGAKLESVRIGSTLYTTEAAVERFIARTSDGTAGTATSPTQADADARTDAKLQAMGAMTRAAEGGGCVA